MTYKNKNWQTNSVLDCTRSRYQAWYFGFKFNTMSLLQSPNFKVSGLKCFDWTLEKVDLNIMTIWLNILYSGTVGTLFRWGFRLWRTRLCAHFTCFSAKCLKIYIPMLERHMAIVLLQLWNASERSSYCLSVSQTSEGWRSGQHIQA